MRAARVSFVLCWVVWGWSSLSTGQIVPDENLDSWYRGLQVLRVHRPTEDTVRIIASEISDPTQLPRGSNILRTEDSLLWVSPVVLEEVKGILRNNGVRFQVHFEDFRETIEEHLRENRRLAANDKPGEFQFGRYHPYDEIVRFLEKTVERYSGMASLVNVANIYEGRTIVGIKIGVPKSTPKRAVWIDAGIHAREWIAPATALYLINQLVSRYGRDRTVTDLVEELDWYIVPVFNADGYIYSWSHPARRYWRKSTSFYNTTCEGKKEGMTGNCSCPDDDTSEDCACADIIVTRNCTCLGVDLNRNWDAHWAGQRSSDDPCSNNYHGQHPDSEPEIKGVADFVLRHKDMIKAYLTLHNYHQMWVSPYTYNATRLPPDYAEHIKLSEIATAAIKRVHGKVYYNGRAGDLMYQFSGTSQDWAYEKAGIVHSYTVELRDTGEYAHLLPQDQIVPTAQELFPAFIQVGLYVWDGPNYEYEYVLDTTSGTGRPGCALGTAAYQWLFTVALVLAVSRAEAY